MSGNVSKSAMRAENLSDLNQTDKHPVFFPSSFNHVLNSLCFYSPWQDAKLVLKAIRKDPSCSAALRCGQILLLHQLKECAASSIHLYKLQTNEQVMAKLVKLFLLSLNVCLSVYLRVHQNVVEQNEPVIGEPAGVLQSQRSVAAFTNHAPLRETQDLLKNRQGWLKTYSGCQQNETCVVLKWKTTAYSIYYHFSGFCYRVRVS